MPCLSHNCEGKWTNQHSSQRRNWWKTDHRICPRLARCSSVWLSEKYEFLNQVCRIQLRHREIGVWFPQDFEQTKIPNYPCLEKPWPTSVGNNVSAKSIGASTWSVKWHLQNMPCCRLACTKGFREGSAVNPDHKWHSWWATNAKKHASRTIEFGSAGLTPPPPNEKRPWTHLGNCQCRGWCQCRHCVCLCVEEPRTWCPRLQCVVALNTDPEWHLKSKKNICTQPCKEYLLCLVEWREISVCSLEKNHLIYLGNICHRNGFSPVSILDSFTFSSEGSFQFCWGQNFVSCLVWQPAVNVSSDESCLFGSLHGPCRAAVLSKKLISPLLVWAMTLQWNSNQETKQLILRRWGRSSQLHVLAFLCVRDTANSPFLVNLGHKMALTSPFSSVTCTSLSFFPAFSSRKHPFIHSRCSRMHLCMKSGHQHHHRRHVENWTDTLFVRPWWFLFLLSDNGGVWTLYKSHLNGLRVGTDKLTREPMQRSAKDFCCVGVGALGDFLDLAFASTLSLVIYICTFSSFLFDPEMKPNGCSSLLWERWLWDHGS